jgi:hypothetical protein
MDAFIGVIGILGVLVALVMLVAKLILKKGISYKKSGLILLVSFVLFIVGVSMPSSTPQNTQKTISANETDQKDSKVEKSNKVEEEKLKAEQTAKEEALKKENEETAKKESEAPIEEIVTNVAKKFTGERFLNVSWEDHAKGKLTLSIKMGENITTNMMKTGMLTDVEKITKELCKYEKFKTLTNFTVIHEADFVDAYGKSNSSSAQIVSLSMESINKINWENFLYDNFPKIATTYFIHPSFNKK